MALQLTLRGNHGTLILLDLLVVLCKTLFKLLKLVLRNDLLCFTVGWGIADDRSVCLKLHVVACTAVGLKVCAIVLVADDNHFFLWLDVDLTSARKVGKVSASVRDEHWLVAGYHQ